MGNNPSNLDDPNAPADGISGGAAEGQQHQIQRDNNNNNNARGLPHSPHPQQGHGGGNYNPDTNRSPHPGHSTQNGQQYIASHPNHHIVGGGNQYYPYSQQPPYNNYPPNSYPQQGAYPNQSHPSQYQPTQEQYPHQHSSHAHAQNSNPDYNWGGNGSKSPYNTPQKIPPQPQQRHPQHKTDGRNMPDPNHPYGSNPNTYQYGSSSSKNGNTKKKQQRTPAPGQISMHKPHQPGFVSPAQGTNSANHRSSQTPRNVNVPCFPAESLPIHNMTISQHQHHPHYNAAAGYATSKNPDEDDTEEWTKAWDDDDDSSQEGAGDLRSGANAGIDLVHPFRPGIDMGFSSSSPVKRMGLPVMSSPNLAGRAYNNNSMVNNLRQQSVPRNDQQQSQHHHHHYSPHRQEEEASEEEVLSRQADKVLEGDGVTWDTSESVGAGEFIEEKPSVKMFFPLLRVLGKGSFGKVVLVRKRLGAECGGLFAMKILRKAHLVKRRQIERTKTERKVLAVADHPFIMKLHFAFQTEDKLYLVLDYCPGGELFFHLSRYRRFPERVARFYSAELVLAIDHLHQKGIIYRDLKPENVLLDAEGHVKLGDFGLAKDKIRHPCRGATSMCGTPEYMAPEVLAQSGHGFCVDYWGLGMLVYEMMTGLPPWYTTDRAKLFKRLKHAPLEVPSYFSKESKNYVGSLLNRDQTRRLGFMGVEEVKSNFFFNGLNFDLLVKKRIDAPIRPCEGWKPNTGSIVKKQSSQQKSSTDTNGATGQGVAQPQGGDGSNGVGTNTNETQSSLDQRSNLQLDIDAATINFDEAFTKMPVHTEDAPTVDHQSGSASEDEVHSDMFPGFTYDENSQNNNSNTPQSITSDQQQQHLQQQDQQRPTR